MSSYFVNSFCGRYPNGADFQLHNYGDHSTANEQYRDSTAMHSSRYGYGYNGMDLTVGRTSTGHFVGSERTPGYSPSHSAATTPAVEPVRYNQSANSTGNSSLSPPPDSLPCSSVASSSPVTETQSQHRAVKNSITTPCSTPCSNSNGATLLLSRDCVSKASPLEEEKPAGSAPTTPQNVTDSTQPQIYPWMRKLHISHGKLLCLMTSYWFWSFAKNKKLLSDSLFKRKTERKKEKGRGIILFRTFYEHKPNFGHSGVKVIERAQINVVLEKGHVALCAPLTCLVYIWLARLSGTG